MWRLPQRSIEHHRRVPGRDVSTNGSAQLSPAHTLMRSPRGPESTSTASRASVETAWPTVAGRAHPPAVPPGPSRGASGSRAAAALIARTASSGTGSPAARALIAVRRAWRTCLAAARSRADARGTSTASGGVASQARRSSGVCRVSKTASSPSPPVSAKSTKPAPASNQNDSPRGLVISRPRGPVVVATDSTTPP